MGKSVNASRMVGLLVLLMAAMVLVSGPVAEVLDLSAPVAEAKKKNRRPAFNVVQCPGSGQDCFGTQRMDRLVGTDSGEIIHGEGGNDVYQGNGGNDTLFDSSTTSNDLYTGYAPSFTGFGSDAIADRGGGADVLDLGSLKLFDEVAVVRRDEPDPNPDDLVLSAPGDNTILLPDHFGAGRRIEKIKFANAIVTGSQVASLARETTPQERTAFEQRRATLEESLDEERPPQEEGPT